MKKLLLSLFPALIFSQVNYSKLDSLDFKNRVETVLKDTGKNFNFHKFKTADGIKILAFKNASNSEDKILFFYTENDNIFAFKSITGKLQTIFPVWQMVADPKALQNKLLKDRSDFVSGYSINELEPDYWMMRF